MFRASPYFNLDLEYEIRWHHNYIKKLHRHKKNPSLFYRSLTSHRITTERLNHFKEHVIEAIPFHRTIMEQHEKRLKAISKLVPKRKYRRLVHISIKTGGTPEYFVYDITGKKYFFVAERLDPEKKGWIRRTKNLVDTVILNKKI